MVISNQPQFDYKSTQDNEYIPCCLIWFIVVIFGYHSAVLLHYKIIAHTSNEEKKIYELKRTTDLK